MPLKLAVSSALNAKGYGELNKLQLCFFNPYRGSYHDDSSFWR